MSERWKVLPQNPEYEISSHGRVRRLRTQRPVQPYRDKNGYFRINIVVDGRHTPHYLHRIVAQLFHPEWRPGIQIGFETEQFNCHIDNLRIRAAWKHTPERFENRPKIKARRVRIVELDKIFRNATAAANFIGGDPFAIYACLRGQRRRHRGYTFETVKTEEALRYRRHQREQPSYTPPKTLSERRNAS